jgi:NADH:ubiquinone oxidoreductase subunit E
MPSAITSTSARRDHPDGKITLERVECNAACDFAPVVMVNWEFYDNQTPESTIAPGRRPA